MLMLEEEVLPSPTSPNFKEARRRLYHDKLDSILLTYVLGHQV
jgi:hypothetical protein